MAEVFTIKKGATSPSIRYRVKDFNGTGGAAQFYMQDANTKAQILSEAASMTIDGSDTVFQYDWAPGDTDDDGAYQAEFHFTYAGGALEKFPNDVMIDVMVVEAI